VSDLAREGARPLVDLAHLNPASAADVLSWFEADPARPRRVALVYSHGAPAHDGFATPRALARDSLRRLRALGGFVGFSVGPPFFGAPEPLKAAIEDAAALPFEGRPGFEGLAIGTDFLGVDATLPGLGNVEEILRWLTATFGPETAAMLAHANARALFS
jgi:membrane dipeptidase